jgi:hypothetical protein
MFMRKTIIVALLVSLLAPAAYAETRIYYCKMGNYADAQRINVVTEDQLVEVDGILMTETSSVGLTEVLATRRDPGWQFGIGITHLSPDRAEVSIGLNGNVMTGRCIIERRK